MTLLGGFHDQVKTAGLALAAALAVGLLASPDALFGWAALMLLPPFLIVIILAIAAQLVSLFLIGSPWLFLLCGAIPALAACGLGLYAFQEATVPVALGLGLGLSTLLPFAAIQFVVALFKRPTPDANLRTNP